ncbi:MAG TPA: glycosyltransferase family 2 protein [Gemmatimonadales bacterium]|jgi:cellulose synthase/poly-beta-1,6-N-acetylglucosamine synthase-like glycosyltransferase
MSELALLSLLVSGYFAVINTLYLLQLFLAFRAVRRRVRALAVEDFRNIRESGLAPPISLVVPAYNEAKTIIDSVRSLFALRYPGLELVVVNDGSTDDTLQRLIAEFGLQLTPRVYWQRIKCKPVRGIYWSRAYPGLWVLDKENGRKADANNAGINLASAPYVCVIDGDSIVEVDAMAALMNAILLDPGETVAAGGTVRIANGCSFGAEGATAVGLPKTFVGASQVLEYLRAFLYGRVAWAELNALMIVSGAFGLFRKDVLVEMGGYRSDTVGEDMDLIVRMHRWLRSARRRYKVIFVPDPVCWTECPETLTDLRKQRERWQRGLGETMDHNRVMLVNRGFAQIGLLAMPYFMFFEYLAPLVEIAGYVILPLGWMLGLVELRLLLLFLGVAFAYSLCLSLATLLLEELSFHRYRGVKQMLRLAGIAVLEQLGLRQLHSWWRLVALITWRGRPPSWHSAPRQGFQTIAVRR